MLASLPERERNTCSCDERDDCGYERPLWNQLTRRHRLPTPSASLRRKVIHAAGIETAVTPQKTANPDDDNSEQWRSAKEKYKFPSGWAHGQ